MRRFGAPVLIAAVVIAAPALAALTPTDVAVAAADCQAATRVVGDVERSICGSPLRRAKS